MHVSDSEQEEKTSGVIQPKCNIVITDGILISRVGGTHVA